MLHVYKAGGECTIAGLKVNNSVETIANEYLKALLNKVCIEHALDMTSKFYDRVVNHTAQMLMARKQRRNKFILHNL